MARIEDVLALAVDQEGDGYVFGTIADFLNPNPKVFDCSELVEWACRRAGVVPVMPDGSWIQARHCRDQRTLMPVADAVTTRGALLFKFSSDPFSGDRPSTAHVAWSLGDGTTIEALSPATGVAKLSADPARRGWTHAGRIPGVDYGPSPVLPKEEEDDMFTFGTRDKPTYFVAGGKAVGLNQASDLEAIRKGFKPGPLSHFELDLDTYGVFVRVYRDGLKSP